jgi:GT2 family glycosyltransferase/SAM-dependent methyltransferase
MEGCEVKLWTVCIVVHNALEEFEACLESVKKHSDQDKTAIAVWDNGTDDASGRLASMIVDTFEEGWDIWDCRNNENIGFSPAVNKLLGVVKTDYMVLLNSDATVGPNWLDDLWGPFLRVPRCGMTAPKGGCHTLNEQGDGTPDKRIDYLEGTCLMMSTHLFRAVGGFDVELFRFAYAEDADLGLCLKELGWKLIEVEMPTFKHERAVTTGLVKKAGVIDVEGYRVINNARMLTRWLPRYLERGTFRRVIVLKRAAARGDVLQLTALARIVADRIPHWRLYADTPWPQLFEGNPHIQALPEGGLEETHEVIDMDGAYEVRPNCQIAMAYAQHLGVPPPYSSRMPEIYLTQTEKTAAAMEFPVGQRRLLIHAGPTGWPGKDAPHELMQAVAIRYIEDGWFVGTLGDEFAFLPTGADDLRGKTMRETAALIGVADLFIGVDSFPASVAYAMRTPAVVVFGCIPPERLIVETAFARGVQAPGLNCLGCHLELPAGRVWSACLRDTALGPGDVAACMEGVQVTQILDAAESVLGWRKAAPTEVSKNPTLFEPYVGSGRGLDLACGLARSFGAETFDRVPYFWTDTTGDVRTRLPFGESEFDWVLTSHNLEDLPCPDWTVREILRILKPGGRILAYVPTNAYTGFNEDHVRLFSEDELRHLLERSGFESIEVIPDTEEGRYSILGVGVKGTT